MYATAPSLSIENTGPRRDFLPNGEDRPAVWPSATSSTMSWPESADRRLENVASVWGEQAPGGFELLFAGSELRGAAQMEGALPPILLEAASWIHQAAATDHPVRVEVTARSFEDAKGTADEIVRQLQRVVLGDPVRIRPLTRVEPDAPDAGTVVIVVAAKGK